MPVILFFSTVVFFFNFEFHCNIQSLIRSQNCILILNVIMNHSIFQCRFH